MTRDLSWPYRLLALAVLALALVGFGYVQGLESAHNDALDSQIKMQNRVIRIDRNMVAINASDAAAHEVTRFKTRTVYQTIEKEVIKYVEASAHGPDCRLDAGWVRIHNAAALSVLPDAASQLDAPTEGIGADRAIPVIARNYEACAENRQQLIDLQANIRKQAQSWMQ